MDRMFALALIVGGVLSALYFGIEIGFEAVPFAVCCLIAVIGWSELRESDLSD